MGTMKLHRMLAGVGYFCAAPVLGLCKMAISRARRVRQNAAGALAQAIQPLEPRMLMTTTLYWAPLWTTVSHTMGGSGTWSESSMVWNTAPDGSGTQRSWLGYGYGYGSTGSPADTAVFGVASGSVEVSGDFDDSAIDLSFTETGYVLDNSTVSGGLGDVSVSVDSGKTARLNAIVTSSYLTKTGYGVMIIEDDINFDTLVVEDGEAELQGEHDVVDRLTVESGAELCITGEVGLDNGAYFENGGTVAVDGGELTLAGEGHEGYVMFNSSGIEVFNSGELLVASNFLNDAGSVQPYADGLFRLLEGATLTNDAGVYMGVYGSPENGGEFQIDYGATVDNAGNMYVYSGGFLTVDGALNIEEGALLEMYLGVTARIGSSGTLTIEGNVEVLGGATVTSSGRIEIDGGSLTISSDTHEEDAILTSSGTLDFHAGTIMIEGDPENDSIGQLENSGSALLWGNTTLTVKSSGELSNTEGAGFAISNGDSDSELTVEMRGNLENDGSVFLMTGGKLAIEGRAEQLENGILDQSGGEFTVADCGGFYNGGDVIVTGGTFANDGFISLESEDLGVIDAINDYDGENNGTVAFNDDIDLSAVTLSGGKYQNNGFVTNDGGLVIDTDTTFLNEGVLNWNDSSWTAFEKVENAGELVTDSMTMTHWQDDSYGSNMATAFTATAELNTAGSSTFTLDTEVTTAGGVDSDTTSSLTISSPQSFTLHYDEGTSTVTFTIGGVPVAKASASWSLTDRQDVLILKAWSSGDNWENSAVRFSNLALSIDSGTPVPMGDFASAGFIDGGSQDALMLSGVSLHDHEFEVTGTTDWDMNSSTDGGSLKIQIEGGTIPGDAALMASARFFDQHDKKIEVAPTDTNGQSIKILVRNGPDKGDFDAECTLEKTAEPDPARPAPPPEVTVDIGGPNANGGTREIKVTTNGAAVGTYYVRIRVVGDTNVWMTLKIEVKN